MPKPPAPHGTRNRYVTGCHCDPCRLANNAYHRRRRGTLMSPGIPDMRYLKPKSTRVPPDWERYNGTPTRTELLEMRG